MRIGEILENEQPYFESYKILGKMLGVALTNRIKGEVSLTVFVSIHKG